MQVDESSKPSYSSASCLSLTGLACRPTCALGWNLTRSSESDCLESRLDHWVVRVPPGGRRTGSLGASKARKETEAEEKQTNLLSCQGSSGIFHTSRLDPSRPQGFRLTHQWELPASSQTSQALGTLGRSSHCRDHWTILFITGVCPSGYHRPGTCLPFSQPWG